MSDQTIDSATSKSGRQSRFALHDMILIAIWLIVTFTLILMLWNGVRDTGQFRVQRYMLQMAYVAALLWYLNRTGSILNQLPKFSRSLWTGSIILRLIPVIGLVTLFLLIAFSDEGLNILLLFMIIATIWILVAWRREIRLRLVVQGLALAVLALLGGLLILKNGFATKSFIVLFSVFLPPMFMAGELLINHTRLGGSQLHTGRYGKVLMSFLWGCLLFVPLGLSNAASGSPGSGITWVTKGWMPLVLPVFSGIAEEIWFRFLLIGLCFFLLRPAFRTRPVVAVLAAVLFSAITFGLGHGRTLDKFLTTGLLYGLPMAIIYVKRDLEHVIGAHYMVNMIPWLMVFLNT